MKEFIHALPSWEIERAVRHTMDVYSHAMDYGQNEAWSDCFTDDAVFLVNDAQQEFKEIYRVAGRAALDAYIAAYPRPPAVYAKHICTQVLLRSDAPGVVVAESFWLAINSEGGPDGGKPNVMAFGRYRDRLVECDDERWRFSERVCETEAANWPAPGVYVDQEEWRKSSDGEG